MLALPMRQPDLSMSSPALAFYLFTVEATFDVALTTIEGGQRPHVACIITQGLDGQTFDSVGHSLRKLDVAGLKTC